MTFATKTLEAKALDDAWDTMEERGLIRFMHATRVDPGEWMGDVYVVVKSLSENTLVCEAYAEPLGYDPILMWTRKYEYAGPDIEWEDE